ncbi:MAG TPA: polysaccharide deacetylase family protein [Gemmatimonadaceae bacterium]|nr:polysaccharide deacetylase family protein [Gemmatimonadaceae bacterium]
MMMRGWLGGFGGLVVGLGLAACGGGGSAAAEGGRKTDSANGVAVTKAAPATANGPASSLAANPGGRIPVLEYHVVGDSSRGQFIITRDKFMHDLQLLYDRGYRPITVAQLLDKDFRDVPAGMSPVIFTFDDASPEQFSYIEQNGRLEIDPKTVVGMWMAFNKSHPDWKPRATFCLLPGAAAGHAFFGDNPKWRGQKKEWRLQKVKWLADTGFEICNHTLWHAQLSKYPDAFVQQQIARGQMAIDSAVPGYKVRTFALPQGLWPKNRALAWRGSWTDPKSGKTVTYSNETVLEVSGGPVRSPFDPQFDKTKLTRLIVFNTELERALDRLDASKTRFVWDGGGAR